MQFLPLSNWKIKTGFPFIIAGPCAAETREQVWSIAEKIKPLGVHLFRSGIWKPRTRPDSFSGVGEIGLQWLSEIKKHFGLPVTVEVASREHVELALKYGIDVLWIGARTTVSPFLVQEIADALKGVDIPVMIKNPLHPDLDLWIGALERVSNAGVKNILAIHRGFYTTEKTKYRNKPSWEIPIELRRRLPDLPIITDSSHICGKRDLLQGVSQKALDLGFDGLMLETHINPDKAWSDAEQQVTPEGLKDILEQLIIRQPTSDDPLFKASLDDLRSIIDKLDEDLLAIIYERMQYAEKIGLFKKENNITIFQPERWNEIIETRTQSATEKNLSPDIIVKIFELIHKESIRKQTEIMNRKTTDGDLVS
jgi:chorismate mutase